MKQTGKESNKKNKKFSINKNSYIIITFLILLVTYSGIRSCSSDEKVDTTKTFVIARDPSGYPLNLVGKSKNVLAFTNDLLLIIAKNQNVKLALLPVSSNRLEEGLLSEKFDGVISSILPTPENNKRFNFSDTFFFVGPVLIVPINSKIRSFSQMQNKIVGIPPSFEIAIDINIYKAIFKPYQKVKNAFNDLYNNQIDGILMPIMQAYTYIDTFHRGNFKVVTRPLSNQGLRIITLQTKRSAFVIHEFNMGLKRLIEDGTYDMLCKKWGLNNPFIVEGS